MPGPRSIARSFSTSSNGWSRATKRLRPVDIALAIGAGEPQVSKALLGLAAEGYLEKVETGKYRATGMADLGQAEFLKAFARASRVDSTRQRDLSDITRLKQNNDIMRQRLLTAIAERDHYLAALKKHGIDPGPAPVPAAPVAETAPRRTRSAARRRAAPPVLKRWPSPRLRPRRPRRGLATPAATTSITRQRRAVLARHLVARHACDADPARGGRRRRAPRRSPGADRARARGCPPAGTGAGPTGRRILVDGHEPARSCGPDRRDRGVRDRLPRPDRGDRSAGSRGDGIARGRLSPFGGAGREMEGTPSIALVAHEPILSALAAALTGKARHPPLRKTEALAHPDRQRPRRKRDPALAGRRPGSPRAAMRNRPLRLK